MKFKNLWTSNDAVAYLLLVGVGLTIVITGICYNFTSDFVDYIISAINNYAGTPLEGAMDADSIATGDMLLTMFKLVLIPALFCIIYFSFVMSQKPIKSW